jgi:CubicO group peptidase (beta-lactamase class C family)
MAVAFADAGNFNTPVLDPPPAVQLWRDAHHASNVDLPVVPQFGVTPQKGHAMNTYSLLLAIVLVLASAVPPVAAEPPIVEKYRELIPQLMAEQNIPGLALAVVDETGVVWAEGFGFTDTDRQVPVTPDTIFSIQSMSKTFTAFGVMRAVQAGLLDLDAPITTYLPDFTVNSIFEEHPERKITLRHLLSCTAGFTHEAPVGNNWDGDITSFDAHIRSISNTWLRFPVGKGYAYSNLGFELAAHILQTVSGQPFADWQRDQVFKPLGMTHSSYDMAVVGADPKRAIGHSQNSPNLPLGVPAVGAGGMYASANNLARFIQLQLNGGVFGDQTVLRTDLLDDMLTVQFPVRGQRYGYGLGVGRTGWYRGRNADLFQHGGGGWGFLSDLKWLPELKVGIALLTNSVDHQLQGSLAFQILDDLVHDAGPYADRLAALPYKSRVTEDDDDFQPPATLTATLTSLALPPDPARWQGYLGEYKPLFRTWIDPTTPPSRVYEQGGALYFDGTDAEDAAGLRLYETAPGLFFTETGEALDFRPLTNDGPPTYRSLKLKRVGPGPSPIAWGILAACGLAMLSALLALPGRPILLRLRRQAAIAHLPAPGRAVAALVNGLTVAGSLSGLASIGLLVALPRLIYAGFLGWFDLPLGFKLILHAPLGLAVCAVALAVLALPAWRRGWWSRAERWQYTALTAAALAETALLAGWRLIGLG